MGKSTIINEMKKKKGRLEAMEKHVHKNKDGEKLVIRHQEGSPRYYLKEKDGKASYLSKAQTQKIRELAQLRYETALFRAAIDEKAAVEKCIRILENCKDTDKVFDEMPDELKPYITPDILTDKGYARKWQRERVESARPLRDGEGYKTLRGEFVRSKSEVIIADRLFSRGIPYRYEIYFPMKYEDISYVYPDFEILNVRTRQEFLWEHLGMLGDEGYSETQLKKISGYARSGFTPGKNLLLSFESKNRPLDIFYVDVLIDSFLV